MHPGNNVGILLGSSRNGIRKAKVHPELNLSRDINNNNNNSFYRYVSQKIILPLANDKGIW